MVAARGAHRRHYTDDLLGGLIGPSLIGGLSWRTFRGYGTSTEYDTAV